MNNNIPQVTISYTGENIDLSYFSGAKINGSAKNTLMIFDIHGSHKISGGTTTVNIDAINKYSYTYVYGLYWVNNEGNAYLVNTPYYKATVGGPEAEVHDGDITPANPGTIVNPIVTPVGH